MKRVLPLALLRTCLYLVLSLALLAFAHIDAFAHRSGCHRWHSCPSDSGSYVCGNPGHELVRWIRRAHALALISLVSLFMALIGGLVCQSIFKNP